MKLRRCLALHAAGSVDESEEKEKEEKTDEEKKPFKLKVPKVPAFLRSKSKEREKQKVR